jgi:methylenetetrahydrofolate reductase (NADPH)
MFEYPYIIELLTPKKSPEGYAERLLERFGERFNRIMQAGCGLSIPDNPMGNVRLGALEAIELLGVSYDPERVVINLNTFHTKDELDDILTGALGAGIRHLLVVRGDGGPDLPRLDPAAIGGSFNVVSSAELIGFINRSYPGKFITGAAFNHYNPAEIELARMEQKVVAGARFIVTQPVIGRDGRLSRLGSLEIPLVIEAWMSDNIELFSRSVGDDTLGLSGYDPLANLQLLHDNFPGSCMYLSMLDFNENFEQDLPSLPA